jgi:prophage regulatory protein
MENDRILRLAEVLAVTGLSKSSLYRAVREGRFPRPVELGERLRGWRASEVYQWIADLPSTGHESLARSRRWTPREVR